MKTDVGNSLFNTTSTEFYINMKPGDIPPPKHPDRLAFINEERRKSQEGIFINGIYIPGTLYYGLNHHRIPVDAQDHTGKIIRVLQRPTLRDNDWILHNDYYQAWKNKESFMIGGSRQISKSVFLVTLACRELNVYDNSEVLALFSTSTDKDTFNKYLQIALSDKDNFLAIPSIDKDLTQGHVRFGLTRKNNEPIVISQLYSYLTKEGKATEIGAGKTITLAIFDEVAKFPFKEVWEAVKPALMSPFGWRCSPILAFTGGNVEKSQDALSMFDNPTANGIMTFENEGRQTGKFMGGWYRQDFKKPMPLNEYLGLPPEGELANMVIQVTDFDKANAVLDAEQEAAAKDKDPMTLIKHRMYYPRSLAEMALSAQISPFAKLSDGIRKHKLKLEQNPSGVKVELFGSSINNQVHHVISDKPTIAHFPHKASDELNAPIVLYEPPQSATRGGYKLYVGGLDPYNVGQTDTSVSLGAFYLMKRHYGNLNDPYQNCMVASYVARPERTADFLKTIKLILDFYEATMLHENSNDVVLNYFDKNYEAETYLCKTWSLQQELSPKSKSRSMYGIPPSPAYQRARLSRTVDYCTEIIGESDTGEPIYGYTRILDPLLLDEILAWKPNLNMDRLDGFGHALLYIDNLDKFEPARLDASPPSQVHTSAPRQPYGFGKAHSTTKSTHRKPFGR